MGTTMNFQRVSLVCALLCVILSARFGWTQGCGVVMDPTYSSYEARSTDGTRIYTSVVVDGAANCSQTIECNCQAVHTPHAYNVIGSTGGWSAGGNYCPNCYITYTNKQSIVATPGVDYSFNGQAEVICSEAGVIYDYDFVEEVVRIAASNYIHNGDTSNSCIYDLSCPNGNAEATCGDSPIYYEYGSKGPTSCLNYLHSYDLVIDGVCAGVGVGQVSNYGINCN